MYLLPLGAPPPSYESVIGRVREVHKESSGTIDFFRKIILLLVGTGKFVLIHNKYSHKNEHLSLVGWFPLFCIFNLFTVGCTIAIGVTIVVPVAMFLIGLRYLNECPVNMFIPVYLLVGGKCMP